MAKLYYTDHVRSRMVERGFRWEDIRLIVQCGTVGDRGRYQIGDGDIAREMQRHADRQALSADQPGTRHVYRRNRHRINRVRQLRGAVVVVHQRVVVTCFGPGGRTARQ